ncbi:hypothetical protein [Pseudomonas huaxiensis]|uniref:hypothetical protein n=1 Tax=Pseudomonas huaxiensis TaxID=2213017 RepID=UPI000DA68707|nr:hypothetical protein [Pseudomonas huaxiensis]
MSETIVCIGCSAGKTLYEAPVVPDALAPLPGESAWVLPVEFQYQPLKVAVLNGWPTYDTYPGFYLDFRFFWGDEMVGFVRRARPFDSTQDFPVEYSIDPSHFNADGIRTLRYTVATESGNSNESESILVDVDRRAPNTDNPGKPLIFPPDVVTKGVTKEWLAANGDELGDVEVPPWLEMKLGDQVLFYWGGRFEAEPVGRLLITEEHLLPAAKITISYSGDVLREAGNGTRYGYYVLMDRAGNRNDQSPPVRIEVIDLPAIPREFPPPVVPLATSDRLIDLEDARTGVRVEIGPIADTLAGDTLQAWWNGRPLSLITLGSNPQWPQSVPVDWVTLSADGFAGAVPCEVIYQWKRGAGAGRNSLPTNFTVDLSVAGPDPVGPDPINPALERVVVKGLTGDNQLVGPDRGKNATVQVRLYSNPDVGDLLELHWGNHPVAVDSYRVQAGDLPGQLISFTVPWPIIEAVGNNAALPVWYWVSNGVNRQRSDDTQVRVAVIPLEGLERVSFPDANLYGFISCINEPWKGIWIKIPGNPQLLEAGDKIQLSWQLSRGIVGDRPMFGHVLFPAVTLTQDQAQNGLNVLMDRFVDLVLPLPLEDGSANVTYHLSKVDGTPGIAPNRVLKISLVVPGSDKPCDGT